MCVRVWSINCGCKHGKGERGREGRERDFKRERYKAKKGDEGEAKHSGPEIEGEYKKANVTVSAGLRAGLAEPPGLTPPPVGHWRGDAPEANLGRLLTSPHLPSVPSSAFYVSRFPLGRPESQNCFHLKTSSRRGLIVSCFKFTMNLCQSRASPRGVGSICVYMLNKW